jgi:hypothetical protein
MYVSFLLGMNSNENKHSYSYISILGIIFLRSHSHISIASNDKVDNEGLVLRTYLLVVVFLVLPRRDVFFEL